MNPSERRIELAIFDLDHTLLAGDSDYEWGRFLVDRGLIDGDDYERQNRRFFADYRAGRLDMRAFARFAFKPLADNRLENLYRWRDEFMRERIEPIILPKARVLVEDHRARGHTLIIATSTNRFITEPIARAFNVGNLLATEPEFANGHYTGRLVGAACLRGGKIVHLEAWLEQRNARAAESWCYSDSQNDIPLLEWASHAIAVDADARLAAYAKEKGWPLISLREGREDVDPRLKPM